MKSIDEQICTDPSKTIQIYKQLRQRLLFQEIPPHSKLDIGLFARQFKVSKTPVREALIMLARDRIVQIFPGSGYFSRSLTVADLSQDYEVAFAMMRHMVFTHIGRFARDRLSAPRKDTEDVVGDGWTEAHALADRLEALYEYLVTSTGNYVALDLIQVFNARTTLIRRIDLREPSRFAEVETMLSDFVDRLEQRDQSGALDLFDRLYHRKLALLNALVVEAGLGALASDL